MNTKISYLSIDKNSVFNSIISCLPLALFSTLSLLASGFLPAQDITTTDFSSWTTNDFSGVASWQGHSSTCSVNVCVLQGTNARSGYPASYGTWNYDYLESSFGTWWDEAGITSSTSLTPNTLQVWSQGADTVIFCFDQVIEGDSNFLNFHQVDFSATQLTIRAYLCGTPLNHNLLEINASAGSSTFTTNATEAVFTGSSGPNQRNLIRFNQDFDSVVVIENNPSDLLALGFMGYGSFHPPTCSKTCICQLSAQIMTTTDFSSWQAEDLSGSINWRGSLTNCLVDVCVLQGTNARAGYPANLSTWDYDYRESWFESWWDEAGVTGSTSIDPNTLHVWSQGADTVVFCFDQVIEGDSNFLNFHEVSFSTTQLTIRAYLCGTPLNHNLLELNESSGSPTFTTNVDEAVFTGSAGGNRRYLVRFNQDFDSVVVIENNPNDLLALGFMGYGNFKSPSCGSICSCRMGALLHENKSIQLSLTSEQGRVRLSWEHPKQSEIQSYSVEHASDQTPWGMFAQVPLDHFPEDEDPIEVYHLHPSNGPNRYRLKALFLDGKIEYSPVSTINFTRSSEMIILDNPVTGSYLRVLMAGDQRNIRSLRVRLMDASGKLVSSKHNATPSGEISIDISLLPSGLYHLSIMTPDGQVYNNRVIIQ